MPLLAYRGGNNAVVTISNDGDAGSGDTVWEFVDSDVIARLPAELSDPLMSLNAALSSLQDICGATTLNVTISVLTLSAWGNVRSYMAVPEFIKWVEIGESSLSTKQGFETPILWPKGWSVHLVATDGYSYGNMAAPRFTLGLTKGAGVRLPADAEPLERVSEEHTLVAAEI
eukprot:CAMPEP_0115840922 /NCGR_PEP_ID=MMETSP0287-20121206/7021_1 /TAXON_ID=412157 /ORGANISM="Chrysochromulina rotalis, Strain UIO044" /LENGTH=171 /DNA_ID=CAMNT_0003294549 /DNA_START=34 /DNA_END=549 /DNA_ORIENTATION=+